METFVFLYRGVDDFRLGLEGRAGDQFWLPQGVQVKAPTYTLYLLCRSCAVMVDALRQPRNIPDLAAITDCPLDIVRDFLSKVWHEICDRTASGTGGLGPVLWGFARGLARGGRSSPAPEFRALDVSEVRPFRPDFTLIGSLKNRFW